MVHLPRLMTLFKWHPVEVLMSLFYTVHCLYGTGFSTRINTFENPRPIENALPIVLACSQSTDNRAERDVSTTSQ